MTAAGSKRARESDTQDPTGGDVATAGVSTASPSSSTRNSKKAKTSNPNTILDEANNTDAADNSLEDIQESTAGDDAEDAAAMQANTTGKRSQRKSALAAKDKIVAAETAADEDNVPQGNQGELGTCRL